MPESLEVASEPMAIEEEVVEITSTTPALTFAGENWL
jgi:hypothetical protein